MRLLQILFIIINLVLLGNSFEQRFLFGYPGYNTINPIPTFPVQNSIYAMNIINNLKVNPLYALYNPIAPGILRSMLPIQPKSYVIPLPPIEEPSKPPTQNQTKTNSTHSNNFGYNKKY